MRLLPIIALAAVATGRVTPAARMFRATGVNDANINMLHKLSKATESNDGT